MPDVITWDDADEIGILLHKRFPTTDPDVASDLELAGWIREIPTLQGNPPDAQQLPLSLAAVRSAWQHDRGADR